MCDARSLVSYCESHHDVEDPVTKDKYLVQRCTAPGCQITQVAEFCTVGLNVCGSSIWTYLHVTLLACRTLRLLIDCWEIYACMIW
jgi:hypothetical protein